MFKRFSILRPILAVLIIFIPLYPKFPLASVTGTYVAIRLDDIIVSVALLFWLIYQIRHKFPVLREPVTKLFVAYLLAIIISFVNAYFINQTEPTNILLFHLLRRFEYISLFFLTISTTKEYPHLREFYIFLALATAGVLAYGFGQKYYSLPVISTMNSEFSKGQLLQMDNWTRISSTFAGHYDLAAFLSIVLVLIGGVIITQKNIWLKIINIILWLLSFQVLTLTASRVSIFAFYGGMCLAILLLKKYFWIVPVTIVFAFSLSNSKDLNQRLLATIPALKNQFFPLPKPTATPVLVVLPTTPPVAVVVTPIIVKITPLPTIIRKGPIEEQIPIDTDVGVARSGEIRFNAEWPRAITAFKKNVLFGTGLGSITLATDNDYLRLLGESGSVGFITFMLIFVYFTIRTIKNRSSPAIIFFAAMITFMINATLIDVFEASKAAYLFWIMMGFYYQVLNQKKVTK
ncbi:O-antigen ligase family protein [Candidatus Shapirobacteria bacterium]|nr:O-antigen ligase family protein [Candidatus Shapirobacteria bacterium]